MHIGPLPGLAVRALLLAGFGVLLTGSVAARGRPTPGMLSHDRAAASDGRRAPRVQAPDAIVVRYRPLVSSQHRVAIRAHARARFASTVALPRTQVVRPQGGVALDVALRLLRADPAVAWAEPD